jgi:phosphate transport system protein
MMPEHTFKQFDQELEQLRTSILQMGGLVEQQIILALQGFVTGDMAKINDVLQSEVDVNHYEMKIDDLCNHIIALRQPAAFDLRMVLTVSKMTRDLERIGDEAEKIARNAKLMHELTGMDSPKVDLTFMGNAVVAMLHKSLDAFARLNAVEAAEVVRDDLAIDDRWRSVIRQLVTFMMEDPRTISRAIEILFVAKAFERIGDHAKNMAEQVVYLVKGLDVRHKPLVDIEMVAKADR